MLEAEKTYHIYLDDRCLFKNLNEWEFNIIWRRIYHAYFKEEISYSVVGPSENPKEYEESSY